MQIRHLLLCVTVFLGTNDVYGHCIDIHSRIVSQGLHYVPGGTNPCTLCICDKGGPKWCKSVLCSPPQNCKSFQVGSSCCEFKCLDDILSGHDNYKETYDVALRFIASTVTAVLSISLLFFLYNRLKRNKSLHHHNHQQEEHRNLSNVGYITGNFGYNQHGIGYMGSGNHEMETRYEETSTNFSLWKPPGNYFPPGEAPPPYEEAMRSAQHDLAHNMQNTTTHNTLINTLSSAYPQEINPALICRHDEQSTAALTTSIPTPATDIPNISSNTHQYVNVRVQVQHAEHRNKHEPPHHKPPTKPEASYENIVTIKNSAKASSTDRLLERPTSSGFTKTNYHKGRSRTQTENGTGTGSALVAAASSSASTSMLENYELVQQTHAALNTTFSHPQAGHQQGRYANTNYNKIKLSDTYNMRVEQKKSAHRTLPKNLRELLTNAEGLKIAASNQSHQTTQTSTSTFADTPRVTFANTAKTDAFTLTVPTPLPSALEVQEKSTTIIKEPKSLLTYQSLSQDEEDYRSECENCKAVASAADDDGEAMNETMSLQRRPLSESGYELSYRTSLTLPTNSRKQQQRYPTSTNNREKWFTTMQQSSSEESD